MYTIYLSLVIGVILSVLSYSMNLFGIKEKMVRSFASFMVVLFSICAGLLLAQFLPYIIDDEVVTYKTEEIEILSLADNTNVEGAFFLGSGRVGSTHYYDFYYKDGNGIKRNRVRASETTIEYTSDQPVLVKEYSVTKHTSKWTSNRESEWFEGYILKVPEGSIKEDFILDAE